MNEMYIKQFQMVEAVYGKIFILTASQSYGEAGEAETNEEKQTSDSRVKLKKVNGRYFLL